MATPEERLLWLNAASIVDEKLHGVCISGFITSSSCLYPI